MASHPSHRPRTSSTDEALAFNLPPSCPLPAAQGRPLGHGSMFPTQPSSGSDRGRGSHAGVTCSGKAARRKRLPREAGGSRLPQDSGQPLAGRGSGPHHPVRSQDPHTSHLTGVWVQRRDRQSGAECERGVTRTRPCPALLALAVAVSPYVRMSGHGRDSMPQSPTALGPALHGPRWVSQGTTRDKQGPGWRQEADPHQRRTEGTLNSRPGVQVRAGAGGGRAA